MNIGWRFPPLSGGTKQGYTNNDIEGFKGEELIDNLAREICQNSLDAYDKSENKPVKVVFELKQVEQAEHDVFAGYKACLSGCRAFWTRNGGKIDAKLDAFLLDAEACMKKPKISVLVASDYNTKGLLGNHDLEDISTPWEALTGADGMSVKPDDNSGGSFGIGKNAPFACSSLSMVFYNTYDVENHRAFIGVGRLATLLNADGKPTQRVGKYQKNNDEEEIWLPIYEEDNNSFRELFHREEHGTDVIIVGFNEVEKWEDNISKAVLKNFFVAIREKKLIVEIKNGLETKVIDDNSISGLIEEYSKSDKELEITRQLYLAFVEPDIEPVKLKVLDEEEAVEVYIKSESTFSRTIANFRSTGMLVGKGQRRIYQHYAAVLIVRKEGLGKLLRACEPPRHNRWDYKLIKAEAEKEKRKQAKQALDYLDDEVLRILKSQYEVQAGNVTDAVGVSAYLPDSDDGALPEESMGTDILNVKVKVGKAKVKKPRSVSSNVPGEEKTGKEISGDTGNQGSRIGPDVPPEPGPFPGPGPGPIPGPNPGPSPDHPVVPNPDVNNKGVAQGAGARMVSIKELSKRRIFPVAVNVGLYKAVVRPNRDYENLFVECVVAGEDGSTDQIKINKFMCEGKAIPCRGNKAGPIKVAKDNVAEFMITFDKKEKMGLNLILSEGGAI